MVRHPELALYLSSVVQSLRPALDSGTLQQLVLNITAPEPPASLTSVAHATATVSSSKETSKAIAHTASSSTAKATSMLTVAEPAMPVTIERFVFDLSVGGGDVSEGEGVEERLAVSLRSVLLKISVCDSMLPPLPEGCTFAIVALTRDSHVPFTATAATTAATTSASTAKSTSLTWATGAATTTTWVAAEPALLQKRQATLVPLKSTTLGMHKVVFFGFFYLIWIVV